MGYRGTPRVHSAVNRWPGPRWSATSGIAARCLRESSTRSGSTVQLSSFRTIERTCSRCSESPALRKYRLRRGNLPHNALPSLWCPCGRGKIAGKHSRLSVKVDSRRLGRFFPNLRELPNQLRFKRLGLQKVAWCVIALSNAWFD